MGRIDKFRPYTSYAPPGLWWVSGQPVPSPRARGPRDFSFQMQNSAVVGRDIVTYLSIQDVKDDGSLESVHIIIFIPS